MMLQGITIVDFSRYLPGPYATLRLADMGADVIKVEPPVIGDPARVLGEQVNGTGVVFLANNRNTKSVTIDLKDPEGQDIALQLASKADVVLEGFRPGVADALGIGYQRLRQARPDIVYCSLTGFGQTGPLRDAGGHDLNYLSLSGVLSQLTVQTGQPVQPGIQLSDLIGGIAASEAILAALVKKALTGEGSYLDVSITDAMIGLMNSHTMIQTKLGRGDGVSALGGSIITYYLYETKDGRFVSLGALEKKFWENFCLAVGRQDWCSKHFSPALETNPTYIELRDLFKSRTLQEWSDFADAVDCCMAPVLETEEMMEHPHVREKRLLWHLNTDEWGELPQLSTSAGGFFQRESGDSKAAPPPALGQHNHEIFQKLLNASAAQVDAWAAKGII